MSGRFYADPDSDDDGDNAMMDAPTTSPVLALQDSRKPSPFADINPTMFDMTRNYRPGSFANEADEPAEDDDDYHGS